MLRYSVLLSFLFFAACESSQDKIFRLQSETLATLLVSDSFEIKTKSQTFKLVLPPAPENAALRAQRILAIRLEANSFDLESLSADEQQRLRDLNAILAALVHDGGGSAFDPTKCVVADLLKDNSNGNTTKILLQKIPEYYAEVERRWIPPNKARAQTAAQQSLQSLDILHEMGDEAYLARLAVKDFIGMCQSAVCLN